MLRFIGRVLEWLRGGALKLLVIGGLLLLAWGIISPVGTLFWWLRQGAESLGFKENIRKGLPSSQSSTSVVKSSQIDCYIVYLPGVGDFSTDEITPGETYFLNRLVQLHPNCVAVKDVFPYSAANKGLGGQRAFAPIWRFVTQVKGWQVVGDILVKIRNLWRFAISADSRYGQIYNQGIASAILERMNAAHPIPHSPDRPIKIILLGTSGGIEVALGAAPYVQQRLDAKITVVSLGGVFDGKSGFNAIDHFYHLRGRRDWIEDIGGIVFPSRWLWNVGSPYNQARQQGRYTASTAGPQTHDGPQGYFGQNQVGVQSMTYVDLTLQQVNQLPIWSPQRSLPPR